ncbi:PREDICTED: uncharacterized protein LOC107173789 [Diuraphis noxia]|uniref:uncharacterized protein LOC107173789 n=1 Tax=Diuraphis noxia TaxID=143948 RepID=UPI0007636A05|nr:PREDICTED: uncharacterized protein LOC107173789 [Diuraphis noxia]
MEAYYMWERVHLTEDMSRSCSSCDCVTYSYFLISVFLFTLGTIISVFSFGAYDDTVFANLGHMWMVGPLCICSAVMIGIRNVLYLRRRRVIDMVIRQQIEDIRSQQGQLADSQQQYSLPIRTVSELTLPPSYEQLIGSHSEEGSDLPPPSYEEAVVSMSKETTKSDNIIVLNNYSVK